MNSSFCFFCKRMYSSDQKAKKHRPLPLCVADGIICVYRYIDMYVLMVASSEGSLQCLFNTFFIFKTLSYFPVYWCLSQGGELYLEWSKVDGYLLFGRIFFHFFCVNEKMEQNIIERKYVNFLCNTFLF